MTVLMEKFHSYNKYLLNTCYVLGNFQRSGHGAVNKTRPLLLQLLYILLGWGGNNKLIENLSDRGTCYAKNEKQKMFWGITGWLFYMG